MTWSADRALARVRPLLLAGLTDEPHPSYPGAVVGLDDGTDRRTIHAGDALRYLDDVELRPADRIPVQADTVFDLASLTKVVTLLVVLGLVHDGRLELGDAVARHLTEYRRPETEAITVRQLLTHTSGLPAVLHLWQTEPDPVRRPASVLAAIPERAPGSTFVYSCTGFLTLALLVERLTGQPFDETVAERVSDPLGLGLGYRPLRAGVDRDRIAATECRDDAYRTALGSVLPTISPGWADRPTDLRGVVHDENAASLSGVAGNSGLFGTADDLLVLGRALLDALAGRRDLPGLDADLVREMVRPQLGPDTVWPGYQSGLALRIDDPGFMGELAGTGQAYGHTGFTGTSLVLDADRDLAVAILTNRVHPSREWSDLQTFRGAVHTTIARADD
ncbi:MAG: serine hydrolase domain-containing protein [Propionibacteriaceae bacterium]